MREKVDVKKHSLVPEHIIMKEQEVQELLKYFDISLAQLPRISVKDPAIKEFAPKAGNVVKIIRDSKTGKKISYYRLVIGDE